MLHWVKCEERFLFWSFCLWSFQNDNFKGPLFIIEELLKVHIIVPKFWLSIFLFSCLVFIFPFLLSFFSLVLKKTQDCISCLGLTSSITYLGAHIVRRNITIGGQYSIDCYFGWHLGIMAVTVLSHNSKQLLLYAAVVFSYLPVSSGQQC